MSRHLVSQVSLLGAATGVGAGAYAAGALLNTMTVDLPHSRALEQEADLMAVELMSQAKIDPWAAVSFWEKTQHLMQRTKTNLKLPSILSTHAHVEARVAVLNQYIAQLTQAQPISSAETTQHASPSTSPTSATPM